MPEEGDIAYYPGGVVVIKDATVRSFSISAPAWRTPEGARVADAAETLRGLYAGRLTAVRNRHQFVGISNLDRFGFMVVDGDDALGFGMAAGRVESITAGSAVEVRRELGVYGPV